MSWSPFAAIKEKSLQSDQYHHNYKIVGPRSRIYKYIIYVVPWYEIKQLQKKKTVEDFSSKKVFKYIFLIGFGANSSPVSKIYIIHKKYFL